MKALNAARHPRSFADVVATLNGLFRQVQPDSNIPEQKNERGRHTCDVLALNFNTFCFVRIKKVHFVQFLINIFLFNRMSVYRNGKTVFRYGGGNRWELAVGRIEHCDDFSGFAVLVKA